MPAAPTEVGLALLGVAPRRQAETHFTKEAVWLVIVPVRAGHQPARRRGDLGGGQPLRRGLESLGTAAQDLHHAAGRLLDHGGGDPLLPRPQGFFQLAKARLDAHERLPQSASGSTPM
jgi:hypothetical protein